MKIEVCSHGIRKWLKMLSFVSRLLISRVICPVRLLVIVGFLADLAWAPDTSGCLINWKVGSYTKNGVTQSNVEACYVYAAVTWLNVGLFWIMWITVIRILMFSMHN